MSSSAGEPNFGPDYFSKVYRDYGRQNPPYKLRFYREMLARHISPKDDVAILDVGCAFGDFLSSLPRTWKRHGIDISSFAIAEARRKHPDIEFAAATLETNPFRGPFDVVTSFDVIEHIADLDLVAASVKALLRAGGVFMLVVPAYDGPIGPVVHVLDRDPTHVHKRSRRFWLEWAAQHFRVRRWTGIYRFLLPGGLYVHAPLHALRAFSPAILVVTTTEPSPRDRTRAAVSAVTP
ncbi:MAG TPA: class I SAM-dependent methyltransferase [Bryobacteraceae bacterium]|nr:class I SAM-dependent methyltransferase [Bryobacteraceae bacterium]